MHLFYNISKDMISIWLNGNHDDEFSICNGKTRFVDSQLDSIFTGIPSSMSLPPKTLSSFRTWKAIDHKNFCLSYSQVFLEHILPTYYLEGWTLFVEVYDLCCRPKLSLDDIQELDVKAQGFVSHFERAYMQYKVERVPLLKYTIHLLLHLKDSVVQNGPPAYHSQFWTERYIGKISSTLNARRNATMSVFRTSLFHESAKMLYNLPFAIREDGYDDVIAHSGFQFFGRGSKVNHVTMDKKKVFKRLVLSYFRRKWPIVSDGMAKELYNNILEIISFPRVKCIRGSTTDCIGSCGSNNDFSATYTKERADYYCAVHMNEQNDEADVYYGRVRHYLRVVLNPDCSIVREELGNDIQVDVMLIDWALRLTKAKNGQVQCNGKASGCFNHLSVEDVSILRRKIAVVDHVLPTRHWSNHSRLSRTKNVCSFIDEEARYDNLSSRSVINADGKCFTLRGLL